MKKLNNALSEYTTYKFILLLYYIIYFSSQPVLHDWCNKGRGMCYPVCGMVHIKEPLLLIDKSSLCGSSGFPFSLSEWSLTIRLTPYNRRYNVLSASLNKTFLSLSIYIILYYIILYYIILYLHTYIHTYIHHSL